MSYEGYAQKICASGHYSIRDAYDGEDGCYCGEKYVWTNGVDQTNDNGHPFPQETLVIAPESGCCSCHPDDFTPATYRVPTPEEMDKYHADTANFYSLLYGFVEKVVGDEHCGRQECACQDDLADEEWCNNYDCTVDRPQLKTKEDIAREMSDCIEQCGLKGEELYTYILCMLKENT